MNLGQMKKWLRSRLYISKLTLDKKEDLLNYNQATVWLKIKFRCGESFAVSQQNIAYEIVESEDVAYCNSGWSPDKVREVIRELRAMGFPILSSSKTIVGGYFTPATKKELDNYIDGSFKRARTIMWPLKRVKKGGVDWLYMISQKTLPLKRREFE